MTKKMKEGKEGNEGKIDQMGESCKEWLGWGVGGERFEGEEREREREGRIA